jgi:hypothetical protein
VNGREHKKYIAALPVQHCAQRFDGFDNGVVESYRYTENAHKVNIPICVETERSACEPEKGDAAGGIVS